jgi:hypothetical protein
MVHGIFLISIWISSSQSEGDHAKRCVDIRCHQNKEFIDHMTQVLDFSHANIKKKIKLWQLMGMSVWMERAFLRFHVPSEIVITHCFEERPKQKFMINVTWPCNPVLCWVFFFSHDLNISYRKIYNFLEILSPAGAKLVVTSLFFVILIYFTKEVIMIVVDRLFITVNIEKLHLNLLK